MAYVIYHIETTKILGDTSGHNSLRAAKAALTRAVNKGKVKREDYAIEENRKFFADIEKEEVRHGVGPAFGKTFTVRVNHSWLGPWSETYWSM